MRVSILTREYPPFIYGGAGVHVGQLVPQLEKFTDLVDVQCMGEPREGATAHAENYPADANGAIRTLGADVAMAAAIPEVDVVHAHTWYAQFAGIIASQFQDIPLVVTAHSLEPDRPWKVEQLGGGFLHPFEFQPVGGLTHAARSGLSRCRAIMLSGSRRRPESSSWASAA